MADSKEVESKEVETKEVENKEEVKTEVKEESKKEARTYTQEEIDRIVNKVKKNERYRTKKEVEAYYQGRESVKPQPGERAAAESKAEKQPVRADYDLYEEFLEAKTSYEARHSARAERERMDKEAKDKEASEAAMKTRREFHAKALAKYPNLDERLEEVSDAPMYPGVQEAIMESALGPEILNELLDNPKEFDRLAAMSEPAAIREIGKLEARLEAKPSKAEDKKDTKPASKAPAPVSPPGGATASTDDQPSDSDDIGSWMAKENRRLAKQRQPGAS